MKFNKVKLKMSGITKKEKDGLMIDAFRKKIDGKCSVFYRCC